MTDTRPHFQVDINNDLIIAENYENYYVGFYSEDIFGTDEITIYNFDYCDGAFNFYDLFNATITDYLTHNGYICIVYIDPNVKQWIINTYGDDENLGLPTIFESENCPNPTSYYTIAGELTEDNDYELLIEGPPTGSWSISNKEVQSLHIDNKEVQTITRVSDGAILYQALRDFVSIHDVTKYYHGSERFVITCYEDGEPVYNKSVSFYINDHSYPRTTDENGQASFPLNLSPGVYNMVTTIDEEVYYNTITILSTVQAEDVEVYYSGDNTISATCLDTTGQPVDNIEMRCNVNGEFYYATTDSNGYVEFSIPQLESDDYIATIMNESTSEMKAINFIVKPTIISSDLTKYYKCSQQFEPVFLDSAGDYITDTSQKAHFVIYGRQYDRSIGSTAPGVAKLNINLEPREYNVTTTNPVTGESVTNTITVLTVLFANDLVMKYKDGSKFIATLLDCDGRPYAGQTIEFNVNGLFYNRVTDSSGQAKWNVGLMAGEYIITSSYNGLRISNTITVTA